METISQKKKLQLASDSRSIIILAGLHLLQSLVLLGTGVYLVMTSGWIHHVRMGRAFQFLPLAVFEGMLSGLVMVVLAMFGFLIAYELLRLRKWAWLAAMSLQGLGLLAALYGYVIHRPNYVGMLMGIFLVFYLNQREIQAAYRGKYSHSPRGTL